MLKIGFHLYFDLLRPLLERRTNTGNRHLRFHWTRPIERRRQWSRKRWQPQWTKTPEETGWKKIIRKVEGVENLTVNVMTWLMGLTLEFCWREREDLKDWFEISLTFSSLIERICFCFISMWPGVDENMHDYGGLLILRSETKVSGHLEIPISSIAFFHF